MTKNTQNSLSWLPRPIKRSENYDQRPIFITGIPRCGSSWVGEILGNCDQSRYVYEPFNFQWMPALRGNIRHFRYVSGQSQVPPLLQHTADNAFQGRQNWKQLGRAAYRGYLSAACRSANRVIVKDPTASLMTAWISLQYRAQTLIVMRHPCGFASSLEPLNWPLNVNVLLGQKELMQNHLERFRDTMRRARGDRWLTRGAIWAAVHTVFSQQLSLHPDWHLVKYEDICENPVMHFEDLADTLGLTMNPQTRQKINALNVTNNSDSGSTRRDSHSMTRIWRQRMSPGEIDAVLGIASEFGLDYYSK